MARRVFFSFHYQRDIWRVNQIRNLPNVIGSAAAGFTDSSLWEETKRKGDAAVKSLIDQGLKDTSVTVVFVGNQTANRTYVNYEIEQSIKRGNGVLAVQIHHLKNKDGQTDAAGAIPTLIAKNGYKAYMYVDADSLGKWIEEAAKKAGR